MLSRNGRGWEGSSKKIEGVGWEIRNVVYVERKGVRGKKGGGGGR